MSIVGAGDPPSQGTTHPGKKDPSFTGPQSDENRSQLPWWGATSSHSKPNSLWIQGKVQLAMKQEQKHLKSAILGLPAMRLEKRSQGIALFLRQGLCVVTSSSH